ncbi:hypothetical protein PAL_GLEAN10009517 [Pteropus alecto]|uniref:Uncharacterized protein n=1 Tax=Pteropus alecto TaxID=9402 RepID=L5L4U2_PTEAL|nr:hypothetical protein PAL_GLEAN10009517 [Pteropus alecto]
MTCSLEALKQPARSNVTCTTGLRGSAQLCGEHKPQCMGQDLVWKPGAEELVPSASKSRDN